MTAKAGRCAEISILRAFQYRNYRLYFFGQIVSLIGTWMQMIAMHWLIYRLTNSPFLLGLVGFSSQLPAFLLTPFAGVLADRWHRLHILRITQTLAMLQAFMLAVLAWTDNVSVWQIVLLSLFLGLVNAFDMPARQTFMVDIVEKRDDLSNAIALNSSLVNIARLVGPSLAGILIALFGESICFFLNGISYLAVILALLLMKVDCKQSEKPLTSILPGLKEGFHYAFGFTPVRSILLLVALISLMGMPYSILMPIFASQIFSGGPSTLGFLMAASGVGALTGALYLATQRRVIDLGNKIAYASASFGFGLILLSLTRNLYLAMIVIAVAGLGLMIYLASSNTILQTIVDDDKRGRVMSFYTMAFVGMMPFGNLLAGTLASHFGAPTTIMIGGICTILGSLAFAIKLPSLKRMVLPIYARLGLLQ